MLSVWPLLQGFGLGATMIIPIGAQNAYVLNQGIRRQHHLLTAAVCAICDILLIALGVFGGGALFASQPTLLLAVSCGGAAFLFWYGFLSMKSALRAADEVAETQVTGTSRRAVIAGTLAVTLLNPHVYLDTVMILGGIGGQFEGSDRITFAAGTMIASFAWFFALSIGAARLSPILGRPAVRRWIDGVIWLMMWVIAFSLLKRVMM
ncbi:LysE/ArgO family amino acid transporter [Kistimonas asteriae]|uniref:LysE/ArgO family amino acid transporter n=1 Tax=Kistimonas asteriae TaxID=517724 RepID=UPI001BACA0B4|nr:LysE/ArgO family amino acid transporter [Kistimonas asteriae]